VGGSLGCATPRGASAPEAARRELGRADCGRRVRRWLRGGGWGCRRATHGTKRNEARNCNSPFCGSSPSQLESKGRIGRPVDAQSLNGFFILHGRGGSHRCETFPVAHAKINLVSKNQLSDQRQCLLMRVDVITVFSIFPYTAPRLYGASAKCCRRKIVLRVLLPIHPVTCVNRRKSSISITGRGKKPFLFPCTDRIARF
jgi:hypothetical protein